MFGHLGGLHVVVGGLKFESKHGGASHLPMPDRQSDVSIEVMASHDDGRNELHSIPRPRDSHEYP